METAPLTPRTAGRLMGDKNSKEHVLARHHEQRAKKFGGHRIRVYHLQAHHNQRHTRNVMRDRRRKRLQALRASESHLAVHRDMLKFNDHAAATPSNEFMQINEPSFMEFSFEFTVKIAFEEMESSIYSPSFGGNDIHVERLITEDDELDEETEVDGLMDTRVTLSVGNGKTTVNDYPVLVSPIDSTVLLVTCPKARSAELNKEIHDNISLVHLVDAVDDWGSQMVANQVHGIAGIVDIDFQTRTVKLGRAEYQRADPALGVTCLEWVVMGGQTFVQALQDSGKDSFTLVASAVAYYDPEMDNPACCTVQ